jgi:hypothetical protein
VESLDGSRNKYIRANSLKAMKEEQDRIAREAEEKKKQQAVKRVKSPKNKVRVIFDVSLSPL